MKSIEIPCFTVLWDAQTGGIVGNPPCDQFVQADAVGINIHLPEIQWIILIIPIQNDDFWRGYFIFRHTYHENSRVLLQIPTAVYGCSQSLISHCSNQLWNVLGFQHQITTNYGHFQVNAKCGPTSCLTETILYHDQGPPRKNKNRPSCDSNMLRY